MEPAIREIAERICTAAADRSCLRIRGGGTKDFYGEPPQGEPLSTAALSGITSYEPSELVVTVRAGTSLLELEAVLAAQGQCLPFEPPRFDMGRGTVSATTVGGMVAAGLSGPARASVGSVRDFVLGASLLNGRGEHLTFGGQVMKNVAGYDVSRVLVGSLGTLGVITELSLKVLPVPTAEATLAFECGQARALQLLNDWGGRPLPLNASCWQDRGGGEGQLLLRLRGAAAAVEGACTLLGGERQDDEQARPLWQAVRDHQPPLFGEGDQHGLWRVSVPQTAPVLAPGQASLIEWHGAQRWYFSHVDEGQKLREAAREVGGHATLFRPSNDRTWVPGRFDAASPAVKRIHLALMREFDPHAVFDRSRLYPD